MLEGATRGFCDCLSSGPEERFRCVCCKSEKRLIASGFTIPDEEPLTLELGFHKHRASTAGNPRKFLMYLITAIGVINIFVFSGEGNLELVKEIVEGPPDLTLKVERSPKCPDFAMQ